MRLATREERRANFRNWRLMLLGACLGLVGVALADHQWVILGFVKSLWPR
jgi:hypothetical protein